MRVLITASLAKAILYVDEELETGFKEAKQREEWDRLLEAAIIVNNQ